MMSSPVLFGDILLGGVDGDEHEAATVVITTAASSISSFASSLDAPDVSSPPRSPIPDPTASDVRVVLVAVLIIVTLSLGPIDYNMILSLFRIGGMRSTLLDLLFVDTGTIFVSRQGSSRSLQQGKRVRAAGPFKISR